MGSGARHTGMAGQMLVKSEFLKRGWNVGSAQVDDGEDLFAIRGSGADFSRIQVKTAHANERRYGYSAQFRVGKDQLATPLRPPLHYVFVASIRSDWGPMVVFSRSELHDLVANEDLGSDTDYAHIFYVRYHRGEDGIETILCSESDLTNYKDDFSRWERIVD